ncbi:hypothetical protein CR513_53218, partial [Mucuna pruriens]
MMNLGNTQVYSLKSFRNMVHQNKMVYQKGVITLMDMVKSMLSNSPLLISLWMYTLKTTMSKRVPRKVVPKTSFELWTIRTPSLRNLYVWDC